MMLGSVHVRYDAELFYALYTGTCEEREWFLLK
jgi:hypothetical protein